MKYIALLLMFSTAYAGTAITSWTNATTMTDGSAFVAPFSTAVDYIQCATSADFGSAQRVTVAWPATTLTVTGLSGGVTYCFRAAHMLADGTLTAFTATVSKAMPVAIPNGPTGFTVAVVIGATWTPVVRVTSKTVFGMVPVGRATGAPLFTYRGTQFCSITPNVTELWGTTDATNLASPCS